MFSQSEINSSYSFRTIIVGKRRTGKTSLFNYFLQNGENIHSENWKKCGFGTRELIVNQKAIKLQVCDLFQGKYKSFTDAYRGVQGVIIAFDITNKDSFNSLPQWLEELNRGCSKNTVKLLVGTKGDLALSREIDIDRILFFSRANDLPYFETSTTTGMSIIDAFSHLAEIMLTPKTEQQNLLSNLEKQKSKWLPLINKAIYDNEQKVDAFPERFLCPINLTIIQNPVTVSYLNDTNNEVLVNYELEAWNKYLIKSTSRFLQDPKSNVPLTSARQASVIPNPELAKEIAQYCFFQTKSFIYDLINKYFDDYLSYVAKDLAQLKEIFTEAVNAFFIQHDRSLASFFEHYLLQDYSHWVEQSKFNPHNLQNPAHHLLTKLANVFKIDEIEKRLDQILETGKQAKQCEEQFPIACINKEYLLSKQEIKQAFKNQKKITFDSEKDSENYVYYVQLQKRNFEIKHEFISKLIRCLSNFDLFDSQQLTQLSNSFFELQKKINKLSTHHLDNRFSILLKVQNKLIFDLLKACFNKLDDLANFKFQYEISVYAYQDMDLFRFYRQALNHLDQVPIDKLNHQRARSRMSLYQSPVHPQLKQSISMLNEISKTIAGQLIHYDGNRLRSGY